MQIEDVDDKWRLGQRRKASPVRLSETPAYPVAEAARYLHLPTSTLRNWFSGHEHFRPVFQAPKGQTYTTLSFVNLVESHVLATITRQHKVPLPRVRKAILFLKKQFGDEHPLANIPLETDKVDILVNVMGETINATLQGQGVMREVIEASLRRIKRDSDGKVIILYPFITEDPAIERTTVMFNPQVAFGRLVLVGTGIPTVEIAQRFKAGESIHELADDYGRQPVEIEDAIRFESRLEAA